LLTKKSTRPEEKLAGRLFSPLLATVMKHKYISILSIICFFLLLGCTGKEDSVGIVIPEKIEDTIPGWFIKAMNLDYSSGKSVTILMHERLAKLGTRIDSFKDKNNDLHIIWEYPDLYGIIDKFRKSYQGLNPIMWYFGQMDNSIIIDEELTENGFTFTFRYPPPGLPWNKLITCDNKDLLMDRENMWIIKTKDKETRMFLFGQGHFCTRIVVF